jgi:diguanylate cyclase (GGDEF)-like protein/PAS domain S-box-containing protein
MFGFEPAEVEGQNVDELILPEHLRAEGAELTERVTGGATFTIETQRRRKDGVQIEVSIIGSPVVINGQQVGTYGIYRDISDIKKAQNEILETQRQVLEANAALQDRTRQLEAANALLERLSNFDSLTGIPNRRYFERFYGLEWRRAARERKWIALIMIDVDFFKAYNDRHGHLAGDACLKRISQTLDEVVNRASDVVCRYGGEEFVVVLSGTDQIGAREVAERMCQRVRSVQMAQGGAELGDMVTLSMGIASEIPHLSENPENLLLRADQALYQAKAKGRDRIEMTA